VGDTPADVRGSDTTPGYVDVVPITKRPSEPTVGMTLRLPARRTADIDDICARLGVSKSLFIVATLEHDMDSYGGFIPPWWDEWSQRVEQPLLVEEAA
jgi:hypothetical protein